MTDQEAFLRAIEVAPWDDAPRLVYADWLEEHGDPQAVCLRDEVAFYRSVLDSDHRNRLRQRLAEFAPPWWPRLTRAATNSRKVLLCAACRLPLTGALWLLADSIWLSKADGTPMIPAGYYWVSDGACWNGTEGHACVNLHDLRNTKPHPDYRRHNGCCGSDGCDGVNTLCGNGHEVGTECSDCWMPHFLHFEPSATIGIEVGNN